LDRRRSLAALAALAASAITPLSARPRPAKLPRVGIFLFGSEANFKYRAGAFIAAMASLGYVQGKTVAYDWRASNGQADLLKSHAAELMRGGHDVVVSSNTATTRMLQAVGGATPIVFGASEDPVIEGFVKSFEKPGGNITGVVSSVLDHLTRHVELLAVVAPRLTRITALLNPAEPTYARYKSRLQSAVRTGTKLIVVDASTPRELENAFPARARDDADGLFVMNDTMFYNERRTIAELSVRAKRPAIFPARGYVEAGGLMSFGPNPEANFTRVAAMVDRILKGARPSELPVEPPVKLEVVVNRETMKSLGLSLPPAVAAEAVMLGR
jgi:putative tryptophan/tyrosine transport system substrate-binding protein